MQSSRKARFCLASSFFSAFVRFLHSAHRSLCFAQRAFICAQVSFDFVLTLLTVPGFAGSAVAVGADACADARSLAASVMLADKTNTRISAIEKSLDAEGHSDMRILANIFSKRCNFFRARALAPTPSA
jgi:hypothetical protein